MQQVQIAFVPLVLVAVLAFVIPLLLSRLRAVFVPVVVGEVVSGIVIGESGLGIVQPTAALDLLSVLGFALLMFLSGLEIDFGSFRRDSSMRRLTDSPLAVGAVMFALTLLGSTAATFGLQQWGLVRDPWITVFILSTTSLGVVVPVLKERRVIGSRYGQTILASAVVADFLTVLGVSMYAVIHEQGVVPSLLLVSVLLVVFAAVYWLAGRLHGHPPARRIFTHFSSATAQLDVRGALGLALVFIALARTLGAEYILGAFLAGVVVSSLSSREGSNLRQKLDAIGYGFLVPIFFIMVGVQFDLPALLASPSALLLVPVLVSIAYAVKVLPALIFRIGYSWRDTLAAGSLLSARLSLIIAAATIGLELGLISEAFNAAVILTAVITCTLSPVLFGQPSGLFQRGRSRHAPSG